MDDMRMNCILVIVVLFLMIVGPDPTAFAASGIPLSERIENLEKIIGDQQRIIQDQQRMIDAIKLELKQQKKKELETPIIGAEQKEMMPAKVAAKPIPKGDSQVNPIKNYNVKIGLQYRMMYNAGNIPLSGVTTAADTENYDFFRQRMRFNIDVQPSENVGGFLQLEYRGGWGGSSPSSSDPRGAGLSLNAFNRLEARGMRYGYIYYAPHENDYLAAGIIPISDQLGDTLFSADWDFNVGGITYNSMFGGVSYRLAYLRMIDGVASSDRDVVGENSDLFVVDANFPMGETTKIGAHIYYLDGSDDLSAELGIPGKVSQGWYAFSGSTMLNSATLNGFVCLNDGDLAGSDNTGWAFKAEAVIPLGSPTLKLMGVYSTGDPAGETPNDQFQTIQGIFGTEGYWAYTHLFTANGLSDVNDLGVGLDNGGRGLTTLQAKFEAPLSEKLSGELAVGWFQSSEDNAAGDNDMGTEISTMFTCDIAETLRLQVGGAYAFLGDFYETGGEDPDDFYEIFSRFQLQF
jgi:hypothetical protein